VSGFESAFVSETRALPARVLRPQRIELLVFFSSLAAEPAARLAGRSNLAMAAYGFAGLLARPDVPARNADASPESEKLPENRRLTLA
jgi:hypothetical protein